MQPRSHTSQCNTLFYSVLKTGKLVLVLLIRSVKSVPSTLASLNWLIISWLKRWWLDFISSCHLTTIPVHTVTECTLTSVYPGPVRDTLEGFLLSGAKLIELDLHLANYPPDFLDHRLQSVFKPHHWVRSTGRQGRSLLVLEDNYDFMSLFFLRSVHPRRQSSFHLKQLGQWARHVI